MREEYDYLLRYGLLLALGLSALAPLYWLITPFTVYAVAGVLGLFGTTTILAETTIVFQGAYIALIPACIAGAAYYLLLICAFTLPLSWAQRFKLIGISWGLFFIGNILRILLATYFITSNQTLFDLTHALFWYAGSMLLVIACWFVTAFYYKVEEIPILTDIQQLLKAVRGRE